jgi:hypothetical protein
MKLTKHAELRMKQRAINWSQVSAVLAFGEDHYHGNNTYYTCLSKKALKELTIKSKELKVVQELDKLKHLFVVSAENSIVTVGFKTKHIHNH